MARECAWVPRINPGLEGHICLFTVLSGRKELQVAEPLALLTQMLDGFLVEAEGSQPRRFEHRARENVVDVVKFCTPGSIVVEQRQGQKAVLVPILGVENLIDGYIVEADDAPAEP